MSKSVPKLLLITTYKPSSWSDCLSTVIVPHNSDTKEVLEWKNKSNTYKIIRNHPMSGFRLLNMSSTENTKWWKIDDPRGFAGTISSSCMVDILQGPGIVQGWLQGDFVWHSKTILKAV